MFHHVAAQLLVVHIKCGVHQSDSTHFVDIVHTGLLQDLDIGNGLPIIFSFKSRRPAVLISLLQDSLQGIKETFTLCNARRTLELCMLCRPSVGSCSPCAEAGSNRMHHDGERQSRGIDGQTGNLE
jgi:hypothetical protein